MRLRHGSSPRQTPRSPSASLLPSRRGKAGVFAPDACTSPPKVFRHCKAPLQSCQVGGKTHFAWKKGSPSGEWPRQRGGGAAGPPGEGCRLDTGMPDSLKRRINVRG